MKLLPTVLALVLLTGSLSWAECRPAGDASLASCPGDFLADAAALPSRANAVWFAAGASLTGLALVWEDPEGPDLPLGNSLNSGLSEFGHVWGHGRFWGPVSAGLWAVGVWRDDPVLAGLGYDLARGLLMTTMITWGAKSLADRTRPSGGPWSFPSGHTAVAFTVAGVATGRCGGWPGTAALVCGFATGLGRLAEGKHFPSDVLAGATIGWLVGRTAARPGRNPTEGTTGLVPLPGGLAVVKSF